MKRIVSFAVIFAVMIASVSVVASAQDIELTLEQTLYNGFKNCQAEIDVSQYNLPVFEVVSGNQTGENTQESEEPEIDLVCPQLEKAMEAVLHMHPDIFHLENGYGFSYIDDGQNKYMVAVAPMYNCSYSEYRNRLYRFDSWLTQISRKISAEATDLQKVLFAHEYFVEHFEYDLRVYVEPDAAIYDAYNFLKEKTGVCQAYTLAFTALMQKFGIFCTSAIDEGYNHCWNIVKLGNNYYHIDITHDDPITADESFGGLQLADMCGRDHLLISDATMKALPLHEDWYTVGGVYNCEDSSSYEGKIWKDYEHPSAYMNGEWYQADFKYKIDYDKDNNPIKVISSAYVQNGIQWYAAELYKVSADNTKSVFKTVSVPIFSFTNTGYYTNLDIYAIGNMFYGSSGNFIWSYNPSTEKLNILDESTNYIVETAYVGGGRIKVLLENHIDEEDKVRFENVYFELKMGDTDGDGEIETNDMVNLKKYLLLGVTEANEAFMDVNRDCFIDILDFIEIKKKMVKG